MSPQDFPLTIFPAMSSLIDSLVSQLQPDLSWSEKQFALNWIQQGPLSVSSRSSVPSIDSLRVQTLADLSDMESRDRMHALLKKLERKSPEFAQNILAFILASRRPESPIHPSPPVPVTSITIPLGFDQLGSATASSETITEASRWIFGPTVTEPDLVIDLVYLIQGISGRHVKFDNRNDVIVPSSLGLARHVEMGIRVLAEMGQTRRRIDSALNSIRSGASVLTLSFARIVKIELLEFQSLAALVESGNWTILKLLAFLAVPLRKMRYVGVVVEKVLGGDSADLLGELYIGTQLRVFRSLGVNFFESVMNRGWMGLLRRWVNEGEVDNEELFFVKQPVEGVSRSSDILWKEKFVIDEDLVPNFLSPRIVSLIFLTGKTTAFLRTFSRRDAAPDDRFVEYKSLETDIEKFAKIHNSEPVKLLLDTYQLVSYLHTIRQYILLGDGGFATKFLSSLLLPSRAPLSKFELTHLFQSSAETSLDSISVTSRGGDVIEGIAIELDVPSPLDVVIDRRAIEQYDECFRFQLKLVYFESRLSDSWKSLTNLFKSGDTIVGDLVDSLHYLRSHLWFFIHELRDIVSHEVVDRYWRVFEKNCNSNQSLDDLIGVHDTYLRAIQEGMFTTPVGVSVRTAIAGVLQVTARYIQCEPSICTELATAVQLGEPLTEFRESNIQQLIDDILESLTEASTELLHVLEETHANDAEFQSYIARVLTRLRAFEI
jgi:hypothetical protein